ncbi:MAG: carboxypeptidase-like regulatory domain-containing protein, partial [Acidobacteriota bacterium]|nr:carboxypeptidase-like regulatory domain-containing protein [Acidobacteriota bacterium]
MRRRLLLPMLVAIAAAGTMAVTWAQDAVEIDADDIGGRVTSADGPEAGVWVVAETTELPTRFIRIVATDDEGLYLLPDLPAATYEIFVRGYGLVDSPRVTAS